MESTKINWIPLFLLTLVVLGIRLNLIDSFSSHVPYFDDWGAGGGLQEYESGELTLSALLSPFNGHYSFWRRVLQISLFDINQSQWDVHLQMVVNTIVWALTALILLRMSMQYFTSQQRLVACSIVVMLWSFPVSIQNVTWGVQTHSYFMILFSLLGIWLVQGTAYSKGWYWGLFFLFAAPLTMGGGAFAALAVLGVTSVKILLLKGQWKSLKPTLIASALISLYCLALLKSASSGHDVYYATSISDFLQTFLKSLSFPLHENMWPAVILLLPILILSWQALVNRRINEAAVSFVLTLFAFTLAITFAIGYARGANGWPPNTRYYEFLQVYTLCSFFSLLLIQRKTVPLSQNVYSLIVVGWILIFLFGALKHIGILNHDLAKRALDKPKQEDVVRHYLTFKDRDYLIGRSHDHIPFASAPGLMTFLDKITQEDILSYRLQVPDELDVTASSTGFIKNGTTKPSDQGRRYGYFYEPVVGSHSSEKGVAATGRYESQLLSTNREQLMIPVTGYIGFPGLSLKVVDEKTGEETPVIPKKLHSKYAEVWQEVYVDAPENAFKLVAEDQSKSLWLGFTASRTIGDVSVLTNWLIQHDGLLWRLAIFLLLIYFRKSIAALLCMKQDT